MTGKIKTTSMKVNCLLQATLGCITVQDFALTQDVTKIFRSSFVLLLKELRFILCSVSFLINFSLSWICYQRNPAQNCIAFWQSRSINVSSRFAVAICKL